MNSSDRRDRIVEYLRIKPTSHGQIHTELLAVPQPESVNISPERREVLSKTLTEQDTNLIPLIVRRTEAYEEEYDYEVVYGADWCIVAQELKVEKLWVWVFDLQDEQVADIQAQIDELLGTSASTSVTQPPNSESRLDNELPKVLDNSQLFISKALEIINQRFDEQQSWINEQFKAINSKLDSLLPPSLLNLRTATKQEIIDAVKRSNKRLNQAEAMWNAIQYWKQPGRNLTWENLEKSAKSKSGKDKITGFADGTYQQLRKIGEIPENSP